MKGFPVGNHPHPFDIRVTAVDRAFDLLEILSRSSSGLSLTELSRRLGIPKSSLHYLIFTLTTRGYLRRTPGTHQYSLGLRVFDFAILGRAERELRWLTSPQIQKLSRRLGLTVQTAVLKAGEGVILDKADAFRDQSGVSWIGRHFDLHCTAQGKALIAWLSNAELEKLFTSPALAKYTVKTICSVEELKAHLIRVREQGYAVNDEEHILGIRGISAPVFNHLGVVIASLSIRGTTLEIPLWKIQRLADEVIRTTADISRQVLEHAPPQELADLKNQNA